MASPAAILRELHRLRRHAKELQAEIDRGPRALKVQQAKVGKQEEAVREAQEAIKRSKIATHEKEVSLRSKNQQIEKYQKQLNESTSKKEYDALKVEIAAGQEACRKLEDDILNVMGETEGRTAQLPELEKVVQRAKDELAQFETGRKEREADLAHELSRVLEEVQQVEATLSAEVRPLYDRELAARGDDAMSQVQGRTCTACYTEITAQNYNELVQGMFVACKSCGRILYLPE